MGLKIFNTLSRSVESFVPLDPEGRSVGMYCCGPTVHDLAHIGNFRTFLFSDLARRFLEYKGYEVRHVMNITDVEDKILARIRSLGKGLREYTARYERLFLEDLKTLGCLQPHETPRATEHIPEMIAIIERLMSRGLAYATPDGSVYFNIRNYQGCGCRYGQLLNLNLDEMRSGERVRDDEYDKESIADFALWKGRAPEDGEVFWTSPWGEGRPGWHIECSAMSMKLLGPSFDLHLGGEDLIFPHHEDEIAQSEGAGLQAAGQRFVKYWLHVAHLLVEGRKMSKSLGNFFTLGDLREKGFSGVEIRYLLLTAHYRDSFNFTLDGLKGARTALSRINDWEARLREVAGGETAEAEAEILKQFETALEDDFNVSAAWGAIFSWIRGLNRKVDQGELSAREAASALGAWGKMSNVLGIRSALAGGGEVKSEGAEDEEVPAEILRLLEERQAARARKNFKRADLIRDQLRAANYVIEDTAKGPRLKRV